MKNASVSALSAICLVLTSCATTGLPAVRVRQPRLPREDLDINRRVDFVLISRALHEIDQLKPASP
jgi:hypothetical protein